MLNGRGSPWAVKWSLVHEVRPSSPPLPVSVLTSGQELVPAASAAAAPANTSAAAVSKRTTRELEGSGERSDGLALERSIMLGTSLLSVAASALMLAKMFADHSAARR